MTDLPYTPADLRAEAADQHHTATQDLDAVGVGEQMERRFVRYEYDAERGCLMPLAGTPRWGELPEEDFDAARTGVDDLLSTAADVSEWAIGLGADGLEPTGHLIEIAGPDGPVAVRLHFAFDADMPTPIRDSVVADLVAAISPLVPLIPQT